MTADERNETVRQGAGSSPKEMMASEYLLNQHFGESRFRRNVWFVLAAILIHAVVLYITYPSFDIKIRKTDADRKVLVVRKYVPPPPKEQPKKKIEKKITKKVAVPDPTPDEPEPIIEPEPPPEPEPLPDDIDIVIGTPAPPPATGPMIPGVGGVANPEVVTRVEPEYPELARRARIEGKVTLRAIIRKDGSVGDIEVVRSPAANLGFEEAAIAALKQWRYRPATQNGRPVDVYFLVNINFTLN